MAFSAEGSRGLIATVDDLASRAGASILNKGGNAVDAAVGASAVLTVTAQHMCGMGGDLWALVYLPGEEPLCLNASGRAGSGADAARLRAEGHTHMPPFHDVRAVTIPGCVDGWLALLDRFGQLNPNEVFAPAVDCARNGFAPSPLLIEDAPLIAGVPGADPFRSMGSRVRREGIARSLEAIVSGGREAWYAGEFGEGLIRVSAGVITEDDLTQMQATWEQPLSLTAWGHRLWTSPPNSQGYLTLASAWIAAELDLPTDSSNPMWVHLLVESARLAGYDRDTVLHDQANGASLLDLDKLASLRDQIDPHAAVVMEDMYSGGGTVYLAALDEAGMGVSLIQSNANGFGTRITIPEIGVFLQNRGIGFSLEKGHPAEYLPGRRPRHTLSPALVTTPSGDLRTILGTMGGDSQPQILLQLLARILHWDQSAARAIAAPRWVLAPTDSMGFDTWEDASGLAIAFEEDVPASWNEIRSKGHRTRRHHDEHYGHAQMIDIKDGVVHGAADPRSVIGSVAAI